MPYTTSRATEIPFIDNPQWVEYIWGPIASVEEMTGTTDIRSTVEGFLVMNTEERTVRVEVLDMTGKEVMAFDASPGTSQHTANLPAGMYVARSFGQNTIRTQKVMK